MNHNKYLDLLTEEELQATVKNIKMGTIVDDVEFIPKMKKLIGKTIKVKPYDLALALKNKSGWFKMVGGDKFLFHKSWLDFSSQQSFL